MGLGRTIKKTYMKAKKKAYGQRGVTGRYYRVGAVQGLQNLAKDVAMIKSRLNVEKKHIDKDVATFSLGQANGPADGAHYFEVTPLISQGTEGGQRIGQSLKLTGMTFPMSFTQQDTCMGDRKVKITLVRVMSADGGVTAEEAFNTFYDPNPLTGLRDFNAPKAYRNGTHDGITEIATKVITVKGPVLNDQTASVVGDYERQVANCRLSVKLQQILRYFQNGDNIPEGIKYYMFFQCNAGNKSGSLTATQDIAVKSVNTGLIARLGQRSWWVDN